MDPEATTVKEALPPFLGAAATLVLVTVTGFVRRWTQAREAPAVDPVLAVKADVARLKRDIIELRRQAELYKARQHEAISMTDEVTRQKILERLAAVQREHEERWQERDEAARVRGGGGSET